MSDPREPEWRQLCVDMTVMKERLFRAGLYRTGHAMDAATRKVGWEVAGLVARKAEEPGGEPR